MLLIALAVVVAWLAVLLVVVGMCGAAAAGDRDLVERLTL
jgi:hypothetical protein